VTWRTATRDVVIKRGYVLYSSMQRRRFLQVSGAAGLTALAGCQTAVGSVALPAVPRDRLEQGGWTKQAEETDTTVFAESYGPVEVEAVASSVTYEDTALATQVAEDTLGAIETTLSIFSATRVDLAPPVDELGPIRSEVQTRIEENARTQLRTQLQEAGLQDIEQTTTGTLTVADGVEARLTEFRAVYPVEDISFPVQSGQSVTIPGTSLEIAALLAVWAADGNFLVAGGAYPAENFAQSTATELSDAISVSVDVDLGLTPESYRQELLDLVTGVR
jgi:hypothetical protein